MRVAFLSCLFLFITIAASAQEKKEYSEYLTVRVQYGNTMSGYKYEVYLDIGVSGSHSMSGQVLNEDEKVTISDDNGTYEFKSDMDLINYLGKKGWVVISTGEVDILDQHYYTYLMERKYLK